MADERIDLKSTNVNELYNKGIRFYILKDYSLAVEAFSRTCELLTIQHKDDLHDSLGDVYLYYGKSLLELYRRSSCPFGDDLIQDVDDESIDDDDDDNDDVNNCGEFITEIESTIEKKPTTTNNDNKDNKKNEKEKVGEEEEEENEDKKTQPSDNENLTDLEVAWEVLEYAKSIFFNRGELGRKYLAETLIVLGEISLESNMFARGFEDMKKGLEIQKDIFNDDSRIVAETLYKIGLLLTSMYDKEAIHYYNECINYLKKRLEKLNEQNKDEIDEINSLIPEIQEKIKDTESLNEEVVNKFKNIFSELSFNKKTLAPPPSSSSSSSSKNITNINHLVRRKRKSDDDSHNSNEEVIPKKKPHQ